MPYQMASGKWRATRMIQGRVKTKSFPTKAEAKAWEARQSAGAWQAESTPTPSICWIDFASAYLKMALEIFARKTWAEKRLAFKRSMKIIPPDAITGEITPAQAQAVLRGIALASSGDAANRVRKNLAAAWVWGRKYYGLPQVNPWLEVERFPADEHPRYVPPVADFWKAYDAANERDKAFLLFLLHTGARVGEAFRLEWRDVDLHNRKVRLSTRKTGGRGMQYAWLPLTTRLHAALSNLRLHSKPGALVFRNLNTGEGYKVRQHFMARLCARAGVKPFGFHAIRHLAATILAYSGLDLPTVQAMLRHHSPTTTARYIKSLGIDPEKIEAAFEAKEKGAKVTAFTPIKKAICT